MSIKQRFSIIFSCLFSGLLATVMLTVYFLFAKSRRDEYVDRLSEKAENTVKLLVTVKEIDYKIQRLIDSNSINRLYNEKVQVFNEHKKLIYSSTHVHDTIEWTNDELNQVKAEGRVLQSRNENDVVGLYFKYGGRDYYVLISATDTYGIGKLKYLRLLLSGAFVVGTAAVWLISFGLSKRSLAPLDAVRKRIQEITDQNLNVRLPTRDHDDDEINELSNSFNQMMDRIDNAYNRQKEFTGNASHELRTPVARIAAQIENLLHTEGVADALKQPIKSVAEDAFQLSEIISSLIALSEINHYQQAGSLQKVRLDEVIFEVSGQVSAMYPGCKTKFEIENTTANETDIEVPGDETLLRIVFLNLFKNAYLYSDNQTIDCLIKQTNTHTKVIITNTGPIPTETDTSVLFSTFYRGSNTQNKPGSGIGLSIVNRVLQYHNASVSMEILNNHTTQVIASFPSGKI